MVTKEAEDLWLGQAIALIAQELRARSSMRAEPTGELELTWMNGVIDGMIKLVAHLSTLDRMEILAAARGKEWS